ncbi:MAG: hypothetical protein EPN45_11185 [Rhizobiaceae bacterium]|nr:MAG: hypothetical protein EPN45_11185 [Rhizobiaceae bacterium]
MICTRWKRREKTISRHSGNNAEHEKLQYLHNDIDDVVARGRRLLAGDDQPDALIEKREQPKRFKQHDERRNNPPCSDDQVARTQKRKDKERSGEKPLDPVEDRESVPANIKSDRQG